MRVILHDLDSSYHTMLESKCDHMICADGRYAPCQGCFGCWTKHPAECYMKDSLQKVCRTLGLADEVVIITANFYGTYTPDVKCVIDRSIGGSTPLSTYRNGEMHHSLRYDAQELRKVIVYGDTTEQERETFTYIAQRNAVTEGFKRHEIIFISSLAELEDVL